MGTVGDVCENPVTGERVLVRLGHALQLSDTKASRVISIAPNANALRGSTTRPASRRPSRGT